MHVRKEVEKKGVIWADVKKIAVDRLEWSEITQYKSYRIESSVETHCSVALVGG